MTFPYKLIDLTHALDSTIPTWNGGCGFNHDVHIDYSDCPGNYQGEDKFRVMKVKMHAGIGTHMDAPSHCISGAKAFYEKLGYVTDFERPGYTQNSSCIFLKRSL